MEMTVNTPISEPMDSYQIKKTNGPSPLGPLVKGDNEKSF
jgi:hypothetical protein